VLVSNEGILLEVADPLEIIERAMRYFYALGVHGAKQKAPVDEVAKMFGKAAQLAALAAPYRHPRLSAVANVIDHSTIEGISPNATVDES
jgi:hypothetical protein